MKSKIQTYLDCQTRALTEAESQDLAQCVMQDFSRVEGNRFLRETILDRPKILDWEKANAYGPGMTVLLNHLNLTETTITWWLAVFLCEISKGIPGRLSMWACTCNEIRRRNGSDRTLTNIDWMTWFPEGVPSDSEMDRVHQENKKVLEDGNNQTIL